MAWEVFTKESRTRSTNPMLTIGLKLGRCALNRAAALMFEKEGVEDVLLMFDKQSRKFGLRPTTKKDARSFSIRYTKDKVKGITGAAFAGVTFLRHIGYDFSTSQSYAVKWNSDESIFEVQLPEERFSGAQQPLLAVEGGKKHGKLAAAGD